MADAFQPDAFQTSTSGTPEAFQSGATSPPPPPPSTTYPQLERLRPRGLTRGLAG